jgi:hypothetical protein
MTYVIHIWKEKLGEKSTVINKYGVECGPGKAGSISSKRLENSLFVFSRTYFGRLNPKCIGKQG